MPPLVGLAVNITLVPEHIVVADGETATEGVTEEFTVIVIPAEVAVVGDAHDSVEVITTVTTSPSLKAVLDQVEPVPTLLLFTFN